MDGMSHVTCIQSEHRFYATRMRIVMGMPLAFPCDVVGFFGFFLIVLLRVGWDFPAAPNGHHHLFSFFSSRMCFFPPFDAYESDARREAMHRVLLIRL